MSTNPPSFRLPFTLPDDVHPAVKDAIRLLFQGQVNHEQAFKVLNDKVNALPTAASLSTTTNTTQAQVIGGVNDQSSQASYQMQQSDYGGLVIINNGASAAAVTTNSAVKNLWYSTIVNKGSASVTLTPDQGTINGGASVTIAAGAKITLYKNSADVNWSAA
jgi:hypothetical protein